ncbi:MAG: hypothetical protein AABY18_08540 [Candidatus Thermoplasmatota archaeon]
MAYPFGLDGQGVFLFAFYSLLTLAQFALVGVLLAAGFNRTANRALAIALLAAVWAGTFNILSNVAASADLRDLFGYRMQRHSFFIDSLALLPFLANYPTRRTGLPTWATKLWPYMLLAFVFAVLQMWRESLGFNADGPDGPLVVVDFLADAAGSLLVPLVLLREVRRGTYANPKGPLLLAAWLPGYFVATDFAFVMGLAGVGDRAMFTSGAWTTLNGTQATLTLLAPLRLLLGLVVLVEFARAARPGAPGGRTARFGLALMLATSVVIVAGMALAVQNDTFAMMNSPLAAVYLWVIGYVALKDQVVGLNRKVRLGISRTALALVFLGVFFVAAQVAQTFLTDEYGYLTGGVVAGMMLFAISPLQRAAERLARVDKAGPDRKVADVYREAVELTLSDRMVTAREERHLAHLAERLGLAGGQAMDIRLAVQQSLRSKAARNRR